ncbi:MAG: SagB/ThcOx family dehydrogenase [bacterium]
MEKATLGKEEHPTNLSFSKQQKINLPEPTFISNTSIENALLSRRSTRIFNKEPLNLSEIGQLAWATQGVNDPRGFRTSPSAGAFYPLNLYILAINVLGLEQTIYKYKPEDHELVKILKEVNIEEFHETLNQLSIKNPAAIFIISAKLEQIIASYGSYGKKYLYMELGHATQNLYLQATSLELGTTINGNINEKEIKKIANMPSHEQPLCLMPVGKKL